MKAYMYHAQTKEYIGETIAQESPLELGEYLLPASATFEAPTECGTHEVAVFESGVWVKKPDYRGTTWWNKTTKEQMGCEAGQSHENAIKIGWQPDDNWTDIALNDFDSIWDGTKWELPFEVVKTRKRAEIASVRWQAETSGLHMQGYPVIDTSRESQALITGAALKATQDPEYGCRWKTQHGFVELNAAQIIGVADAVRAHVQACFDREAGLTQKIDAAISAEEVSAIVW